MSFIRVDSTRKFAQSESSTLVSSAVAVTRRGEAGRGRGGRFRPKVEFVESWRAFPPPHEYICICVWMWLFVPPHPVHGKLRVYWWRKVKLYFPCSITGIFIVKKCGETFFRSMIFAWCQRYLTLLTSTVFRSLNPYSLRAFFFFEILLNRFEEDYFLEFWWVTQHFAKCPFELY